MRRQRGFDFIERPVRVFKATLQPLRSRQLREQFKSQGFIVCVRSGRAKSSFAGLRSIEIPDSVDRCLRHGSRSALAPLFALPVLGRGQSQNLVDQSKRLIHRFRIGKHGRDVRIQENDVCSSRIPFGVRVRTRRPKVVFRQEVVDWF